MVPSRVSNKKMAVPDVTPFETGNEAIGFPMVMLKTSPVGEPGTVVPGAGGMVTTVGDLGGSGNFWPAPLYRVDLPVTLSLTQKGLPLAERVKPQALTKSESVALVTKSVRLYCANVTAGRTNSESAEAARSFQYFIVNLVIFLSSRETFQKRNKFHVITVDFPSG